MSGQVQTDQYAVLIRLPFPRGDFHDPPAVDWDAERETALWELISRPSKDGLDWNDLSERFGVSLQFLKQKVAWLYERQLTQMRAQMRKAPQQLQSHSNSPSPTPGSVAGSTALGGQPQRPPVARMYLKTKALRITNQFLASRAMSQQVSQQVFQQRDALQPTLTGRRTSSTSTATINRVPYSRDIARADALPSVSREQGTDPAPRRPSVTRRDQPQGTSVRSPPLKEDVLSSSSEESDSSESDEERITSRFPRWRNLYSAHQSRASIRDDEQDDEEEVPAFLPLPRHEQISRERPAERATQELSGTLRLDAERRPAGWHPTERQNRFLSTGAESGTSSTGMSSASSTGVNNPATRERQNLQRYPYNADANAEQPRQSPQTRRINGSDGTPSMGSSFSDLDDTSVTQSALEEALMSNMQHGGMASRMSTISQALRSKYLQ